MNNRINIKEFHQSVTKELNLIKDRVRNLIGDAHWGEEGRYKEAIVKNIFKKFLPANISLGTGFILKNSDIIYGERSSLSVSKQIDIIVYDNSYPLLFSEGEFIVVSPKDVKAIIEVKTSINNSIIGETIDKANFNGTFLKEDCFNGLLVFNKYRSQPNSDSKLTGTFKTKLEDTLCLNGVKLNHICFGTDTFIKYWPKKYSKSNPRRECFSLYSIEDLSFTYFLSNLIHNICDDKVEERLWYLYPLPEGKETFRTDHICI